MRVTPLTDAECRELVAVWDEWWQREHPDDFHPYSELWRRLKHAREHPEEMIPHQEAMAAIREGRPARNFKQLNALNPEPQCLTLQDHPPIPMESEFTQLVHNHGPEDGPGLACRERVIDGFLTGECLIAASPHPVPEEPRKGDLLDDATEEAIAAFGAAKWSHGRNGTATDRIAGELERTANLLRARIRELCNG
jgi:hypothetical protein